MRELRQTGRLYAVLWGKQLTQPLIQAQTQPASQAGLSWGRGTGRGNSRSRLRTCTWLREHVPAAAGGLGLALHGLPAVGCWAAKGRRTTHLATSRESGAFKRLALSFKKRGDRKSQVRQYLSFHSADHRPMRTKNQLYKNQNIA